MMVERRLAAILAADVVAYSRLMDADEEGTIAALHDHRKELIDPIIASQQGRIVKTTGDGLLLEFPSVVNAVDCAVQMQEGMAQRNANVGGNARIVFRVGINLGDIVVDGDDILGSGVNVAARLEAFAEPGGICVSGRVYDEIENRVPYRFHDEGAHMLKNIDRPVRIWSWISGDSIAAGSGKSDSVALTLPDKPSIAILPFNNMSGDPEQEYFADGMTEDIITALSKIRSLFVIARNSSFTYKGKSVDVREISRNLGVRYILEGSVRKAAGQVRITGQLIDAMSGNHIWAERFDGSLEDVFELQDQVTAQVAAAVAPSIRAAEIARARRTRARDLTAYDLYLQALAKVNTLDANGAFALLAEARERSPDFAPAYGLEAWCRTLWMYWSDQLNFSTNTQTAIALARSALKTGDDDPELLGQIGYTLAFFEENVDLGRDLVQQGLAAAPCLAWLWSSHGFLEIFWGDCDRALDAFDTAQRLDPRDPLAFRAKVGSAICFVMKDEYEKGLKSAQAALELSRDNIAALRFAAVSAAMLGRQPEAAAFVEKLLRIHPNYSSRRWYENMPIRHASGFATLLKGMQKAGLPE